MKKLYILILLLFVSPCFAATYYIDYDAGNDASAGTATGTAWKTHPYMANTAVSGYSHSNGDKFIFKGGVTWPYACFPLTIASGGAVGSIDEYTGGQLEGSPWGTGKPVFDGGETYITGSTALISATTKSYIKINGLKLANTGDRATNKEYAGSNGGGRLLSFVNCEHIEISYCDLHPYGSHVFVAAFTTGVETTYTGYTIHHNDVAYYANAFEFGGVSGNNATVDAVKMYNNDFHDMTIALVNQDHGDTFHQWNTFFTNFEFYNNKFYGSNLGRDSATAHTADIFCNDGGCGGSKIYNNVWSTTQDINTHRFELGGFGWTNYSGNVWYLDFSGNSVPSAGVNGTITTMYVNGSDAGAMQENVGALDANGKWWRGNTGAPNYTTLYMYDDAGDPDVNRAYDYYQLRYNNFQYSPGVVQLGATGSTSYVYSNTFDLSGWRLTGLESGAKSFIQLNGSSVDARNNIIIGAYYANLSLVHESTFIGDNNVYADFVRIGTIHTDNYATLAEWRTFLGGCPGSDNECSSSSGTEPTFASPPTNMALSSTDTIAMNLGATLGSPYNVDILAVARPQGAAYDIGAYEYAGEDDPEPPVGSGTMTGGGSNAASGSGGGTISGD